MSASTIKILTKAFFKGRGPLYSFFSRIQVSKSKVARVLTTALMIVVFLYFLVLLGFNYYGYQTLGLLMDFPAFGLFLAGLVGFAFLFLFSLSSGTSLLYSSSDIQMISSLAIPYKTIGASRLVIFYLFYAPLYWFVSFPALVVGAFLNGISPLYVSGSILYLLLGPIPSLSISILLSLVLVHITKGRKHTMAEELISMITMVVFIIGFSVSMTRNLVDSNQLQFDYTAMMETYRTVIERLPVIFPFFKLQATMFDNLAYQCIFLICNLVIAGLLIVLVGSTYAKNLSFVQSNKATKRRKGNLVRRNKVQSVNHALVKREFLVIKSESVFVFELVGELGVPLILLGIYALTGVLKDLSEMVTVVTEFGYLPQVVFLVLLLVANISLISSTSISRQGKLFVLDKQYPIPPQVFVNAKLCFHMLLVGTMNILYITAAVFLFGLSAMHLLWMIPLSFSSILIVANLHLSLDYRHPNLDWTITQQAMKSNPNGLLGMLVSLTVTVAIAVFLLLPSFFPIIPACISYVCLVICVALGVSLSYKRALGQARVALSK